MQGFVAVGKIKNLDSVFNGNIYDYEQHQVYEESFKKQHYFATQLNDFTLISNQKLFIENAIREQNNLQQISKEPIFEKGIKTLDNNADLNVIIHLPKLHNDALYSSQLKVASSQWNSWEFYDIAQTKKQVYSGISMAENNANSLINWFSDIKAAPNTSNRYVPYAASEIISFSFDDYAAFYTKYANYFDISDAEKRKPANRLLALKGFSYFTENNNKAMVLSFNDIDDFVGDEPHKVNVFGDINVYKCTDDLLVDKYFSKLIPNFKTNFYAVIDQSIVLAQSKSYLQKAINDYQNGASLINEPAYKKLHAEIPGNYNIEIIKNNVSINHKTYITARTYNGENHNVFANYVMQEKVTNQRNGLVEQVLSYTLQDKPTTTPQLVYNYKLKQYNIIFQNADKELVMVNLKGKTLWKTKIKGTIVGKIKAVDLYRNHKIQYTFTTPHHWYIIDRLGRNVDDFPEYFMQKITQGISVFDYDSNRKYRFGITQSNKFRLYDDHAKKVKGFKVKTEDNIISPPQHFRIGNKDFIVMQDEKGALYLLNRRGEVRIETKDKFNTTVNSWGVLNHKFVNIDDNSNVISIALDGKVKTAKIDLGKHILSTIKNQTLVAISDNKLLINKKIVKLDLGTYNRAFVAKNKKNTYILLSNTENQKIYGFDKKGKSLSKFPIIGQAVIDVKTSERGTYILAYDQQNNLIVYRF